MKKQPNNAPKNASNSDQTNGSANSSDSGSQDGNRPSYYIAIGASAGGFEALQEFFQNMPPNNGAGFIVIQHLSPDFKSIMAELLGRTTKMESLNAVDGIAVEANKIYLIPPRKNMMIAEGKLILSDRMPERGPTFPIDIFFRSLAEDQQHQAIGIVLSGTGSDGSRGIQAIKEVGGLVIVQDPTSAKFDGMPYNAVKTGYADMVVTPKEMPQKLLNYINHPLISSQEKSLVNNLQDREAILHEVFNLLNKRSQNDFTQYKTTTVARRIERRMGINQLTELEDYYKLLTSSPHELQTLSKDMLIGVTRFFRDADAFKYIEENIITKLIDFTPVDEPIRVWITGCSTGEEAYSIAILFDEALKEKGIKRSVKIFATDVDPNAIAEASAGQFPLSLEYDISETRLKSYFNIENEHYSVVASLRKMIVFAVHNLIKDPPFSNIHLVTCRNILIYFQNKTQNRVLSTLHFALRQHGYLFLGASETLGELISHFETMSERHKIYRKLTSSRVIQDPKKDFPKITRPEANLPNPIDHLMRSYQGANRTQSYSSILEKIIGDYVPPCVLLDEDFDILHVYGDIAPYTVKIKPGRFSAKLIDIVSGDLSIALSTALHRAVNQETDITYKDVMITSEDNELTSVTLVVRYVKNVGLGNVNLLVLFDNPTLMSAKDSNKKSIVFDASEQSQQRIRDLESELQKSRENLQVTVEELETTNEELQASNEELLAANEELQSTNEELQSVNEELYTVNSEYQEKIEEISQINTDYDNIINSTDIGIMFLDRDMLIRSFTPAITHQINLLHTDIGRPFHHIAHNLIYPSLLHDIAKVIETFEPIEQEISTNNSSESTILLKIVPYYNEFSEANGCVLTLTNVSRIKMLEGKLQQSYKQLRTNISASLVTAPKNLKILIVDDDQVDRQAIIRTLKEIDGSEFMIYEASTAEEAEKKLQEKHFDICFIDYLLDGKNALEIVEGLPLKIETPFILLSGYIDHEVQAKALRLGVYDAVDKDDMTPRLLERCIRYTLNNQKTEKYLTQADANVAP